MENKNYLNEQIITYIGNKRKLIGDISCEVERIMSELGVEKANMCDLFSGSGVVSRLMKQYSKKLFVNDLEQYSKVINECYLTNKSDFDEDEYDRLMSVISSQEPIEGVITKNYAPKCDDDIKVGERVFYTHENAVIIDTIRTAIDSIPEGYRKYFLAPLLYEASVHTNTSGVFKGFYKSSRTGVGKFGGDGENALDRIKGKIVLKKPVLSDNICDVTIFNEDANTLVENLYDIDIMYMDPPYNQHPYGSNYFMLNTIINNKVGNEISKVSGIPNDWNRSVYNKKHEALSAIDKLISKIDSKYIIVSYNDEGFITYDEMIDTLSKYGGTTTKEIDYVAFRGSRNLMNRKKHTTEYLFTLKKK